MHCLFLKRMFFVLWVVTVIFIFPITAYAYSPLQKATEDVDYDNTPVKKHNPHATVIQRKPIARSRAYAGPLSPATPDVSSEKEIPSTTSNQ